MPDVGRAKMALGALSARKLVSVTLALLVILSRYATSPCVSFCASSVSDKPGVHGRHGFLIRTAALGSPVGADGVLAWQSVAAESCAGTSRESALGRRGQIIAIIVAILGVAATSIQRAAAVVSEELVIDPQGFLTKTQKERLVFLISKVQDRTGFRVRLIAKRFPKAQERQDAWEVDDDTIVLVADKEFLKRGGSPSLLKFDLGPRIYVTLPRRYWGNIRRLYGNNGYVEAYGAGQALFLATANVCACLLQRECADGIPLPDAEVSSA